MFLKAGRKCEPYFSQFLAVFTAALGVLANGIEYGWPSPAVPLLLDHSRTPVVLPADSEAPYWLQILYILGCITQLPITCFAVNRLGRRRSILAAGTLGSFCWVLIATATTVEQLYVARFLGGMGANLQFVSIPMYTAEIAEPEVRGFLGTLTQVMNLTGVLLAYIVIPHVPLWASSALGLSITLTQVFTFYWQPESPYYLLIKKDTQAASASLSKLRSISRDTPTELQQIAASVERQESERGRPQDLLLDKGNRKASIIMAVLNAGQHMTGSSVLVMNMQTILASTSEVILSAENAAVLFGVAMLVSAMFGSVLIDKFGRKILLVSSYLLSSAFLLSLGLYMCYKPTNMSWLPLFSAIGYAFAFKYGLGLVPIVATAEMFPSSLKALGMVVSDLWFTAMAMLSLKLYHATSVSWGLHVPFLLFAGCGVVTAAFLQWYMPETKGYTLEEIQMLLKGKKDPADQNKTLLE